jgi:hypothetical protein
MTLAIKTESLPHISNRIFVTETEYDSGLLGCDAVSIGKYLLSFRRSLVPQ